MAYDIRMFDIMYVYYDIITINDATECAVIITLRKILLSQNTATP